jgi:hypothetical protein
MLCRPTLRPSVRALPTLTVVLHPQSHGDRRRPVTISLLRDFQDLYLVVLSLSRPNAPPENDHTPIVVLVASKALCADAPLTISSLMSEFVGI